MTSRHQTDQELVAAALNDRNSFAAIIGRYEAPLRRYIVRLGAADPDAATDILQETFIKAYVNLNDYDLDLSFSAWLYRIAHNQTIDQFRKQKNRPRAVEREEDLELFERIADKTDIAAEADAALQQRALQRALNALEERYRDVLILRFFEEKTYEEISDILEMPTGTVATHIMRAKVKLKDALKRMHADGV